MHPGVPMRAADGITFLVDVEIAFWLQLNHAAVGGRLELGVAARADARTDPRLEFDLRVKVHVRTLLLAVRLVLLARSVKLAVKLHGDDVTPVLVNDSLLGFTQTRGAKDQASR